MTFYAYTNQLTGYAGGADKQLNWTAFNASGNALSATAINAIMADLVLMQAATGDASATITLTGGTNANCTGQCATDADTLNAAGWTVTANGYTYVP